MNKYMKVSKHSECDVRRYKTLRVKNKNKLLLKDWFIYRQF